MLHWRVSEALLNSNPVLIVHGGAWDIPDELVHAHLTGVRNALDAGWRDLAGLDEDPDLAPLRVRPEWAPLRARLTSLGARA